MPHPPRFLVLFLPLLLSSIERAPAQPAQSSPTNAPAGRTNGAAVSPAPADRAKTNDLIARIRDEGLNRSQITNTLIQLTDVFGPRLTGSPNFKRAAEWSRRELESWGLSEARLESWGPFGRGWSLQRFSAEIIEPQAFPLNGFPFAWSPGLDGPVTADVILVDATTEAELDTYKGRLKGVIALVSSPRDVRPRTEPDVHRLTEANLLQLANLGPGRAPFFPQAPGTPPFTNSAPPVRRRDGPARAEAAPATNRPPASATATNRPPASATNAPPPRSVSSQQRMTFAHREGALAVISVGGRGDGTTFHIEAASMPARSGSGTNGTNRAASSRYLAAWATNAPAAPPQVQLQAQDYNRLVRLLRRGEKLRMHLDLQVKFHGDDLMGYNVLAEIPGGDRKDEVVMLGGHLDSWHSGTGATDNAAGVAVAMEAVRILQAVHARPRRTVRVALWGGEEQGLLGSKAYVTRHFGYYTNLTNGPDANIARSPKDDRGRGPSAGSTNRASRTTRKLIEHRGYDKFSAYFNLDNGTGKIRGIYQQGNEAVRPLFRQWLEPFRDLGAETLSLGQTSATDHLAFDDIGLPGFQFVQDPFEYFSRTHHSNLDVYDRLQIDDLKQASVIMAAFVYQAAMLDEKLPRKPAPKP